MVRVNQKDTCYCLSTVVHTEMLHPRPKPMLPEVNRSLCTLLLVLRHPNESYPAGQRGHCLSLWPPSDIADKATHFADRGRVNSKHFCLLQMWLNYLNVFKKVQCQSIINFFFQQNGCFPSVLLADSRWKASHCLFTKFFLAHWIFILLGWTK